jgi:UDP-N-acetylglucosamine 2-epimerase (non-hydrolysing)
MKIAPIHRAMLDRGRFRPVFVHTGQHYDTNMSAVFLEDFGLPEPDYNLNVGAGTHAEQTGRVMIEIERVIKDVRPDVVVVFGDVNSTIAAALTAVKLSVPVAHVEAGLRSFDRTMPEEINRLLTDAIADFLFAPSSDGVDNLAREGVPPERIHLVGNVMIDTLDMFLRRSEASNILESLELAPETYGVATLHRPSNVDDRTALADAVKALTAIAEEIPLILVAHPRTQSKLAEHDLRSSLANGRLHVIDPLGYIDFLRLLRHARLAVTDSGGIQEETTVLGVPCLTMRTTTERPITISEGTNTLVGTDPGAVLAGAREALQAPRTSRRPHLWDGRAAPRIVAILARSLSEDA